MFNEIQTSLNISYPENCGYSMLVIHYSNRARKSRTTIQNKVRLKVLPEQLTLFVNTSVTLNKCIIQ